MHFGENFSKMRKMKDFFKQRGFWLLLACTLLAVLSARRFDANPPAWVYEVMTRK